MIPVESLELTSKGIVGGADRSRRRQVTILDANAWDLCTTELGVRLDPSLRRANVLVRGMSLANTRGRILRLGDSRVLVGGEVTPCDKMDAALNGLRQVMRPEWRGGVFAQVITAGTIRIGDSVSWNTLEPETSVTYRRINPSDVPVLSRLRNEDESGGATEERTKLYLTGQHNPQYALKPRTIFGAFENGELVGYVAGHLSRRFDCQGELQWIYVAQSHRGTEVASKLFQLMAVWFVERSARRICVDVDPANAPARGFYARHGAKPFQPYWMVWDDIAASI
jgi:MOSC domain-containing protein YiiM/GNAT superfamily N-acetyltransferase